MIAEVLKRKNLYKACRQVVRNKGSAGIDGMKAQQLSSHIEGNRDTILTSILGYTYVPDAILSVEIPKGNGKTRLLGIPTVTDRWLQQAVSQVLASKFELTFEPYSYGFRPKKNAQQAVSQSLKYINDGFQDIVDIDLKAFVDETVRRCGRPLHSTTTDLQQGKMSNDHVVNPQMAKSTYPN